MSFDWNKFIELSERIMEKANSEEEFRTVVSRSYYGAFKQANDQYKKETFDDPKMSVHNVVIMYFQKHDKMLYRSIGLWLGRLKDKRVTSDYKAAILITKKDACESLDRAKSIVNKIVQIDN